MLLNITIDGDEMNLDATLHSRVGDMLIMLCRTFIERLGLTSERP